MIRKQTNGQRSLDDFCRHFFGGESGAPKVVPYTFDDLVRELNAIAPYDWAGLLKERTKATSDHAPLGGIEGGGWRLVYNDKPNVFLAAIAEEAKITDARYSLGFVLNNEGNFIDVMPGSPAYRAGLGPGMKLLAVNGRRWSSDVLRPAITSAQQSHQPIELIVETADFFKTYSISVRRGSEVSSPGTGRRPARPARGNYPG